jgi:hypothetical protein
MLCLAFHQRLIYVDMHVLLLILLLYIAALLEFLCNDITIFWAYL